MSSWGRNQPTGKAPILQINSDTFQAVVTATVTAVMAQFNANNACESRSSADYANRSNNQENQRVLVDKDTPYHKPKNKKRMFWDKKGEKVSSRSYQKTTARNYPAVTTAVATSGATSATKTPVNRYVGNLPKCNKCNYHHTGACREMQCTNWRRKGHTSCFCGAPTRPISQVNKACYKYGKSRHFKRECPT